MTTYNYSCPGCGNAVEIERKMTDPELEYECPTPECGTMLVRVFNVPTITFNAKGFYSTGG